MAQKPKDTIICVATQQGGAEIMYDKCPTITASAGMSGNNQPIICLEHLKETVKDRHIAERVSRKEIENNIPLTPQKDME